MLMFFVRFSQMGDPQMFHKSFIRSALVGVENLLWCAGVSLLWLLMQSLTVQPSEAPEESDCRARIGAS